MDTFLDGDWTKFDKHHISSGLRQMLTCQDPTWRALGKCTTVVYTSSQGYGDPDRTPVILRIKVENDSTCLLLTES